MTGGRWEIKMLATLGNQTTVSCDFGWLTSSHVCSSSHDPESRAAIAGVALPACTIQPHLPVVSSRDSLVKDTRLQIQYHVHDTARQHQEYYRYREASLLHCCSQVLLEFLPFGHVNPYPTV